MLQGEHSATFSTFIKLLFLLRPLFCLLLSDRFTQVLLYVFLCISPVPEGDVTKTIGKARVF